MKQLVRRNQLKNTGDNTYDPGGSQAKSNVNKFGIIIINDGLIAYSFFLYNIVELNGIRFIAFTGRLYRDGVLGALQELGVYKRPRGNGSYMFIREINGIIEELTPSQIKDLFDRHYFREDFQPLVFFYKGLFSSTSPYEKTEAYLTQSKAVFDPKFLEHLESHNKPVLKDDRHNSYFVFKNLIVRADREGLHEIQYSELGDRCVWKDHVIDRHFSFTPEMQEGHFTRFISNVSKNDPTREKAFHTGIGYMLNHHNHPSQGQAVVCYDENPSVPGEPTGGTGKGLFCNAIKQLRHVLKVDGKKIKRDDKFRFQGVTTRTQVFWLDDVHKEFPFEVLHSVSTDGWSVEEKFKAQFYIPSERGPKIILCSNTVISGGGATNLRRQFILEFSDHYSQHIKTGAEQPIVDEHGCIFFDNEYWDSEEWNKFYSFMLSCSYLYHKEGLKPYTQVGQERSRLLQTTSEAFVEWASEKFSNPDGEYDARTLYEEYLAYSGDREDTFFAKEFNRWLKVYAEFYDYLLISRKTNSRKKIRFEKR